MKTYIQQITLQFMSGRIFVIVFSVLAYHICLTKIFHKKILWTPISCIGSWNR